jgi:capsular polysaccharide biosynthesis protein
MKLVAARAISNRVIELAAGGVYNRFMPSCYNIDILSDSLVEKYSKIWKGSASYPDLSLFVSKDVFMVDVGYLFIDGFLVEESVIHLSEKEKEHIYSEFCHRAQSASRQISGVSLNLKRRSSSNYGHWLIEFLPWFFMSKKHFVAFDKILLEYYSSNIIGVIQQQTLSLSFAESSSLIERCNRQPYLVQSILIPSQGCIHSHTKHPLLVSTARNIGLALASQRKPSSSEKIFVARKSHGSRSIVNAHEMNIALGRMGFDIVYPEEYTHLEQVSIFSSAALVVGVSGAAMTNILYCKKGASVICLCPSNAHEYFFWDIACHLELSFCYLFCKSEGSSHRDLIYVDLTQLTAAISSQL